VPAGVGGGPSRGAAAPDGRNLSEMRERGAVGRVASSVLQRPPRCRTPASSTPRYPSGYGGYPGWRDGVVGSVRALIGMAGALGLYSTSDLLGAFPSGSGTHLHRRARPTRGWWSVGVFGRRAWTDGPFDDVHDIPGAGMRAASRHEHESIARRCRGFTSATRQVVAKIGIGAPSLNTGLLGRPWRPSVARTASSLAWLIRIQGERFSTTICTNLLRPGRLRKCSTYQRVCLRFSQPPEHQDLGTSHSPESLPLDGEVCDHAVRASSGLLRRRKGRAVARFPWSAR
jgi:hypothetical protein